jgi:hypothetical protein
VNNKIKHWFCLKYLINIHFMKSFFFPVIQIFTLNLFSSTLQYAYFLLCCLLPSTNKYVQNVLDNDNIHRSLCIALCYMIIYMFIQFEWKLSKLPFFRLFSQIVQTQYRSCAAKRVNTQQSDTLTGIIPVRVTGIAYALVQLECAEFKRVGN